MTNVYDVSLAARMFLQCYKFQSNGLPTPSLMNKRFRRSRIGLTMRAVPKLVSVLVSRSAEPRLGILAWPTLVACFWINSLAVPRYEIHSSP